MKVFIRSVFVLLLLISGAAQSQGIEIDAREAPYSGVPGADVVATGMAENRHATTMNLMGLYIDLHPPALFAIPNGSVITIIYADGSSEKYLKTCTSGTACVKAIPGSRRDSNGNAIGGGGGGGGGAGGYIYFGGLMFGSGCIYGCVVGTVEVGEIEQP
ncbi:MAG: hypothetical protein KDI71_04580 [Xanthomonadales bacterium]|nr:hypothetical protein [Xanthomonadales bacterium]